MIDLLRNNTGLLIPFKSHDIHAFYVSLHRNARNYKEQVKTYNDSRQQEGKEAIKSKSVEMNNFQNPQVRKNKLSALLKSFVNMLYSDIQSATFGKFILSFVHHLLLTFHSFL